VTAPVGLAAPLLGPVSLLDAALDLHPSVSVRPEPFGALLYHFGTRRLSFLKDPRLLAVVQALAASPSVRDALAAAGVAEAQAGPLVRALEVLVGTDMLVPRPSGARP
jgi:putative mycofactocin binding protein MftB